MALERFFNLREKLIEEFGMGTITEESIGEIMVSMAVIEVQLKSQNKPPELAMEEIDAKLYDVDANNTTLSGPSKKMRQFALKERHESARRIDWVIAYGKLCTLRQEAAELEAILKRLRPED